MDKSKRQAILDAKKLKLASVIDQSCQSAIPISQTHGLDLSASPISIANKYDSTVIPINMTNQSNQSVSPIVLRGQPLIVYNYLKIKDMQQVRRSEIHAATNISWFSVRSATNFLLKSGFIERVSYIGGADGYTIYRILK